MKTASVREVQHHFKRVLSWVQQGEDVQITMRNKPVAKLIPSSSSQPPVKLPDFALRARAIWGKERKGKSLAEVVIEDRAERS